MEWLGFESGIIISLIGMFYTFLFCGIIGAAIWVADLIISRTRWAETKVEKSSKEKKEG